MAYLRSLYYENTHELYISEHTPLLFPHATLHFDSQTKDLVVTNTGRTFVGHNLERELLPAESYRLKNGNYVSFGARFIDNSVEKKCNALSFVVVIADPWENPPECVTCGICQDVLNTPLSLPCGHIYCRQCVTKWAQSRISSGERPTCPKCRKRYSFFFINKSNTDLDHLINCMRNLQKTRE